MDLPGRFTSVACGSMGTSRGLGIVVKSKLTFSGIVIGDMLLIITSDFIGGMSVTKFDRLGSLRSTWWLCLLMSFG